MQIPETELNRAREPTLGPVTNAHLTRTHSLSVPERLLVDLYSHHLGTSNIGTVVPATVPACRINIGI